MTAMTKASVQRVRSSVSVALQGSACRLKFWVVKAEQLAGSDL